MSKILQMLRFKGSTEDKRSSERSAFGYEKAVNDKKVPDPVDSGFFCNTKKFVR
jgi:hypothetical protein